MKRFAPILSLLALLSFFLPLAVQAGESRESQMKEFLETTTPEERAQMQTDQLADFLKLSSEQTEKLKTVNLDHAKRMEEIFKSQGKRFQKLKQARELKSQKEEKYQEILTPDQWNQYEKKREEMRRELKQIIQERRNSQS
ncbi:MAG: hypothetical protein MI747_21225 [Desulfobacterales bacterium]|nr:hypothetical protein [Desulfobacterales bacterium]